MAELADALDLGSSVFDVWVRVPSRALRHRSAGTIAAVPIPEGPGNDRLDGFEPILFDFAEGAGLLHGAAGRSEIHEVH